MHNGWQNTSIQILHFFPSFSFSSEYFMNKIITIRNSFPPINPRIMLLAILVTHYWKLLQTFTPVTEQFVLEILQKPVPKLCNLDAIPTKLLYENHDVLLLTITNIIHTSLASGLVPPDFKTAIVKPLLKKPSLDQNVLKRSFYTNSLHTSMKITSAILSSQPITPDTALRLHSYAL